jgi:hypothetical protein
MYLKLFFTAILFALIGSFTFEVAGLAPEVGAILAQAGFLFSTKGLLAVGGTDIDIEAIVKTATEKVNAGIEKLKGESATELNAVKAEVEKIKGLEAELKNSQDAIFNLNAKLEQKKSVEKIKTLADAIADKRKDLDSLMANKTGAVELKIKADTVNLAAAIDNDTAYVIPGIAQLATKGNAIEAYFGTTEVGADSNGEIKYMDQFSVTRGADWTAEAATISPSDLKWKMFRKPIEAVKDTVTVTYEMMRYNSFVQTEIERLINVNIEQKVAEGLVNGNGTSPEITGILTYVNAFNAGTYAGIKVTNPSLFDLLTILKAAVSNGREKKYMPNFVAMNINTLNREILHKTTDGARDSMLVGNTIAGLNIVIDPNFADGVLVVGDDRYYNIYRSGTYVIEFGYKTGDFEDDLISIKGRRFICPIIRNADVDGFLKVTDVDEALVAITASEEVS